MRGARYASIKSIRSSSAADVQSRKCGRRPPDGEPPARPEKVARASLAAFTAARASISVLLLLLLLQRWTRSATGAACGRRSGERSAVSSTCVRASVWPTPRSWAGGWGEWAPAWMRACRSRHNGRSDTQQMRARTCVQGRREGETSRRNRSQLTFWVADG